MFEVLSYEEELRRASQKLVIPEEVLEELHDEVYREVDIEDADLNAFGWNYGGRGFYVYANPSTGIIPYRVEYITRYGGLEFYSWLE